ncbi:MAG: DUF2752 domain-containing protein [Bacteroidetes bacterium]|nr:DUF2752 domain-containing protein [Bacteroidota bacterium]
MSKTPAYVIISWVFLILIGVVLGYSYFFYPAVHPINCAIKQFTGKECSTCGFSRAFSHYSHFQFDEGKKFNPASWHVFLFFILQFVLRTLLIAHYTFVSKKINSLLIKTDVHISICTFLLAFLPLLF